MGLFVSELPNVPKSIIETAGAVEMLNAFQPTELYIYKYIKGPRIFLENQEAKSHALIL
jgi:hypothetical protein